MPQQYRNLKELRERLLHYRQESVARLASIELSRLVDIEENRDAPTIYELEALARLYGIEPEILGDVPIKLRSLDSIQAMASLNEFRDVSDNTKARVVAAANAARDLVALKNQAETGADVAPSRTPWPRLPSPPGQGPPWSKGKHYASLVRERLKLGMEPIPSMRDLVSTRFPWISVLYAHLGNEGLAGLTFADRHRGPTIVLNLDGKNRNPCVRRFSLAHELCHVLVDWNRRQPLAQVSGFLSEEGLDREQRANAFASRFLCPENVTRELGSNREPAEAVEHLIGQYGLHLRAAILYLQKAAHVDMVDDLNLKLHLGDLTSNWVAAEEPQNLSNFPVQDVPVERRTEIALYAASLYSKGIIPRDRFSALLGVTPFDEVEQVLDLFALDPPLQGEFN